MAGRAKSSIRGGARGTGTGSKAESAEAGDHGACAKTTLSEANRERLSRPVRNQTLLREYEIFTGEAIEDGHAPTWREFIAAKTAYRAATSETGTRDAKELRESSERAGSEGAGKTVFLPGMSGLPRTNAVRGKAPGGTEAGGEREE
jgi:hypothetical protein